MRNHGRCSRSSCDPRRRPRDRPGRVPVVDVVAGAGSLSERADGDVRRPARRRAVGARPRNESAAVARSGQSASTTRSRPGNDSACGAASRNVADAGCARRGRRRGPRARDHRVITEVSPPPVTLRYPTTSAPAPTCETSPGGTGRHVVTRAYAGSTPATSKSAFARESTVGGAPRSSPTYRSVSAARSPVLPWRRGRVRCRGAGSVHERAASWRFSPARRSGRESGRAPGAVQG